MLLCGADHYLKIGLQKGIAYPSISQGKLSGFAQLQGSQAKPGAHGTYNVVPTPTSWLDMNVHARACNGLEYPDVCVVCGFPLFSYIISKSYGIRLMFGVDLVTCIAYDLFYHCYF